MFRSKQRNSIRFCWDAKNRLFRRFSSLFCRYADNNKIYVVAVPVPCVSAPLREISCAVSRAVF